MKFKKGLSTVFIWLKKILPLVLSLFQAEKKLDNGWDKAIKVIDKTENKLDDKWLKPAVEEVFRPLSKELLNDARNPDAASWQKTLGFMVEKGFDYLNDTAKKEVLELLNKK